MLILLSLIAADVPVEATIKTIEPHVVVADESNDPPRSRYRVEPNVAGPADGKADALAVTGADCERIGNLYCLSTPRRIYQLNY